MATSDGAPRSLRLFSKAGLRCPPADGLVTGVRVKFFIDEVVVFDGYILGSPRPLEGECFPMISTTEIEVVTLKGYDFPS